MKKGLWLSYFLIGLLCLFIFIGILVRNDVLVHAQGSVEAGSEVVVQEKNDVVEGNSEGYQVPSYIRAEPEKLKKASIMHEKRSEDAGDWFGRILSVVGIFGLLGIAWLLSNNRWKVKWKLVAIGTAMQLGFAMFILWTPIGKAIFMSLNTAVTVLLDFTRAGTDFMFSSFVSGQVESAMVNTAMSILPPIIFFSSLMTILYHLGVMQLIVKWMAVVMIRFMGTSGSESLSAVANIFVGQTEAPLVVKPYVANMTQSELMAIMTGGFATVAGGVMAAYVAMLQPMFPDIAGHLIAASVMSAPAALVVAKIMIPETEESETMGKVDLDKEKLDVNVIDAAARGAGDGMKLALNVLAMLLAFVALIAMLNYLVGLPSRIKNAQAMNNAVGFLISNGGEIDESCLNPYSSSDAIVCTHKALLGIGAIQGIAIPTEYQQLSGDESEKREQVEHFSIYMIDRVRPALEGSAMVQDCENGRVASCGAVLSLKQSEYWTENLEFHGFWPMLSMELIFGFLFFPLAWLMGVPLSDCFLVGQLLGEKMVLNEFIAYIHLSSIMEQLHFRSIVIATYALCGFANFGSIAIQLGGIGGIAPNRRSDLAKLGFRAMIAGTLAAFMTATIAGALVF